MQPMVGIQLSVFGKTLQERFLQMTGWILQPCSVRSQVPRFQCLLVDGHTPEWCEGDALISLGDCWTPSIGENPPSYSGASACSSWQILQASVPEKYYLSPGLCSCFLRLAVRAGCPPPKEVEYLLLKQGGRYPLLDRFPFEIDGAAGQKQFAYMEPIKLKNPSVTAEGYVINGRAFVDYILHAEDMEKA